MCQRNFFNTLNESLQSEGLLELWPLGTNIAYNETVGIIGTDGETYISVYRDERGMYERPIHYSTI